MYRVYLKFLPITELMSKMPYIREFPCFVVQFFCRFPAPLSPDLIELRLENKYYRSVEAVKHDMRVMLLNAQTYFEKNAEIGAKMKRLSEWFTKTLSKLVGWGEKKACRVVVILSAHMVFTQFFVLFSLVSDLLIQFCPREEDVLGNQ